MSGNRISTMAWRNLWRHRRRTLLTLASIVFGIFLAVMAAAMQDRNWADMIDLAARLGNGHVSIQHEEYLDTPTLSRSVPNAAELASRALSDPEVERAVARIGGPMMLSSAAESTGAGFIAYDPGEEDEVTLSVLEALDEGEHLEAADSKGIVLGRLLADKLRLELGDKVVFTMTDKNGDIVSGLARLSGVIRTGSPALDGSLCLLPIGAVREVLGYGPEEATQVALFLNDQRASDRVAARVGSQVEAGPVASGRDVLAGVPGVAVRAWHESQPDLAGFIAMKVGGARVMSIVIALMVAAGIFNTLFVSVMERLREFGIMLAIGWSPGKLFRLVMLESTWLAIVGLVAAAVVTIGPYQYLASKGVDMSAMLGDQAFEIAGVGMSPVLKVGIFPGSLSLIVVFAVLATLGSGIYPAWKASRVEPVETIRLV